MNAQLTRQRNLVDVIDNLLRARGRVGGFEVVQDERGKWFGVIYANDEPWGIAYDDPNRYDSAYAALAALRDYIGRD